MPVENKTSASLPSCLSQPSYHHICMGGFGGVVLQKHKALLNLPALETIANRAHFLVVSGLVWEAHPSIHTKTTTSSSFFFFFFQTKLQEALTFYSQAIRSYLECVTRAILHHLTDQEPPCKAGLGMSRYRFGEKREWGM